MISAACERKTSHKCYENWCSCHCHHEALLELDLFAADARRSDPDTSKAAAEGTARKQLMMDRLLAAYATYNRAGDGLAAEDAALLAGYTPEDGAWKRVSDLKRLGLVADTGIRIKGTSGRSVALLAITPEGVHRVNT
jgi:hypothetical protein